MESEIQYPRLRLWQCLCDDAIAHVPETEVETARRRMGWLLLRVALTSAGFRCIFLYRLGNAAWRRPGPFGRAGGAALFWLSRHWYTCAIAPGAVIGGGVILPHPQGIVVGHGVVIGARTWIFQNVTIGGTPGKAGSPRVGADVRIFAGAVIAGPVSVGDNVIIGANAVVARDVGDCSLVRPADPIVVPLPDRMISNNLSKAT